MNDPHAEDRRQMREAIEHTISDADTNGEPAVVVAWHVVAELATPESRWLAARYGGPADGEHDLPAVWLVEGMLRHAIGMLNAASSDGDG